MHDLSAKSAYELKTPYAFWQETEGIPMYTLEWQEGSIFSPPLNTWHQHFNADSSRPARFISLTSAAQAINQYRNLESIFNNPFIFSDRYRGEAGELTK